MRTISFCLLSAVLCLVESSFIPLKRSDKVFTSIIAFGDSYTANGSLRDFYSKNSSHIDNSSLHPSTVKKPKRSTNGLMWVEHLSVAMGNIDLYDFAQSGATANNKLVDHGNSIDMTNQVTRYLASDAAVKAKKSNPLHLLWTGVNDIDLLFEREADVQARKEVVDAIAISIQSDIKRISDAGARDIILLGLLPLEVSPKHLNETQQGKKELKQLVIYYNDMLRKTVSNFGSKVTFYDVDRFFQVTFGEQELRRNADVDCGEQKKECGDLIWWNPFHLTTQVHVKLAQSIAALFV